MGPVRGLCSLRTFRRYHLLGDDGGVHGKRAPQVRCRQRRLPVGRRPARRRLLRLLVLPRERPFQRFVARRGASAMRRARVARRRRFHPRARAAVSRGALDRVGRRDGDGHERGVRVPRVQERGGDGTQREEGGHAALRLLWLACLRRAFVLPSRVPTRDGWAGT